jgi:AAA+ ATPase superfamily predicted ATPase
VTAFVGRDLELAKLRELAQLDAASLVVIKGRRRVGKSRLATEFAARLSGYRSVLLTGVAPDEKITAGDEREDFASQLSRALAMPPPRADDWNTLLWALADRTATGKWIIILDEINWPGAHDATFLGKLKSAWDLHFSKNNKMILILSGSLTSWIERNIFRSTGFVGRVHLDLTLDELPLRHSAPFLEAGHRHISSYEWHVKARAGSKRSRIRVLDNYTRFYFRSIKPNKSAIERGAARLPAGSDGVLGLQFENLILKNRPAVWAKLGISVEDIALWRESQSVLGEPRDRHRWLIDAGGHAAGCQCPQRGPRVPMLKGESTIRTIAINDFPLNRGLLSVLVWRAIRPRSGNGVRSRSCPRSL